MHRGQDPDGTGIWEPIPLIVMGLLVSPQNSCVDGQPLVPQNGTVWSWGLKEGIKVKLGHEEGPDPVGQVSL